MNWQQTSLVGKAEARKAKISQARVILMASLALVFLIMSFSTGSQLFSNFDKAIGDPLLNLRSEGLTTVAKAFTVLGNTWIMISVLLAFCILFLVIKRYWEALFLVASLLGAYLIMLLVKGIIARPRPDIEWLIENVEGFSFPSGHAMFGCAFYGMIGYLLYQLFGENKVIARVFLVLFALNAIGIGLSRVYLGVHYASDVVAGFLAGTLWLIVCIEGLRMVSRR